MILQHIPFDLQKKTENEYAGPCPWCGGDDRFIVRIDENRFFCRGCKRKGDEITFLMDFKGMKYVKACKYLGIQPKAATGRYSIPQGHKWHPKPVKPMPCDLWQKQTRLLIDRSMNMLRQNKTALDWLKSERGLTDETIKAASLGWNHSDVWRERSEFGLDTVINSKTGKPKKVWVPAGLIIPYIIDDKVIRVRIRQSDPGAGDRYILLPGSDMRPMVWGENQKIICIVESELDGILINQLAGDLVGIIAIGTAQARPDDSLDRILKSTGLILNSLDNDEAGAKEAWTFWKRHYHQVKRWPCVGGKDPGEMFNAGVGIRKWIDAGINKIEWIDHLQSEGPKPEPPKYKIEKM